MRPTRDSTPGATLGPVRGSMLEPMLRATLGGGRTAPKLLLPLVLLLALPAFSAAGPPWITVEYPPNPLDRETRDALLVVRTYHHAAILDGRVDARAEGAVAGERRSVALAVEETSRPGVYAVRGELPEEGAWVVVVEMRTSDPAVALVAMEPDGTLTAVRVPHESRDGWAIPRAATAADIDAMLRTARALAQARREVRVGSNGSDVPPPGPSGVATDGEVSSGEPRGPAAGPGSAALLAAFGIAGLPLGVAGILWRRRR